MLYLDTSALLKLYVRETGSEQVHERVISQDFPLPIWEIQECELINAMWLKVFCKELTTDQAQSQIDLFDNRKKRGFYYFPNINRGDLMVTYRQLSRETPRLGCRSLDIMHVACAIQLQADVFITFDERQRNLASFAGLQVPDM